MVLFSITKHSYYCQRQHYLSLSISIQWLSNQLPLSLCFFLSNHLNVHNKLYNLILLISSTNNLIDHQFKMNRSSTFSSIVIDVACPCFAFNVNEDARYNENSLLIKELHRQVSFTYSLDVQSWWQGLVANNSSDLRMGNNILRIHVQECNW